MMKFYIIVTLYRMSIMFYLGHYAHMLLVLWILFLILSYVYDTHIILFLISMQSGEA